MDNDERTKERKAFDDTKLGVKGLVDAGIVNIPKMFKRPIEAHLDHHCHSEKPEFRVPVIDLQGLVTSMNQKHVVEEIRIASETWGFFQVVNHGIPTRVLDDMIEGIRAFNERDVEAKKAFYRRDWTRSVNFNSNYDLFQSETVSWRDTLFVSMSNSDEIDPNELPYACRDSTIEYINHIKDLGNKLFDLLSEALGLQKEHLRSMKCNESKVLASHYYPECPQPDLAIGNAKHSDYSFITILAQDQIGGLQVLHQNRYWVDVEPIYGALVVNIGDFLQLVSNDKFKSNEHRVVSSHKSRVSVAFFFAGCLDLPVRMYGPIEELTSEENPPKYRQVLLREHAAKFYTKGLRGRPKLEELRL